MLSNVSCLGLSDETTVEHAPGHECKRRWQKVYCYTSRGVKGPRSSSYLEKGERDTMERRGLLPKMLVTLEHLSHPRNTRQKLWSAECTQCSRRLMAEYFSRNPAYCVGPAGHMRNLRQDLDQQDRNAPRLCPACTI